MTQHLGAPVIGAAPGALSDPADPAAVDVVRAEFPALQRMVAGRPVAYFDGPGGTQVPRAVGNAITDYLYHHNANTHWAYPTSEETDAMLLAARAAFADFLGGRPEEVAFGANMTTLAFHVSRALAREFGPGDEIVVTELDHHANVAPWARLARECGATLRAARLDPATGTLDAAHLASLLGPRTRLLAIGAASNALGTMTDVAAAAALARAANPGALVFVDAVHYAPHELVDVAALGCDFLACSSYKFYGPHLGILWGRRALLEGLDVAKLLPAPDEAPERLETGTPNLEGIAGAAAAVDWIASLGGAEDEAPRRARLARAYAALARREEALVALLWEGLGAIPGVRRYGPPPGARRTGTVSFTVRGAAPWDVARALAAEALFLSTGDFYAQSVIERLGLLESGGLVRAGCAAYTTREEVERLLDGVARVARGD